MAKKAVKKEAEAVEEAPRGELIVVPKKALSLDVGPKVIAAYSNITEEDQSVKAQMKALADKRYDTLATLTNGILHAAKNDDGIDLSVYFAGDSKAIQMMNDRVGVALGWRDSVMVGEGDKAKPKVVYSESVAAYFPRKDDAEEVKQKKKTVVSNFMHAVKKCAMAAAGILESDAKVSVDKESGTLKLSGPAIKKEFGVDSVLLNEKQKVEGKKGETIALKQKPSFTQMANVGARAHGAVLQKRKQSGIAGTAADPTKLLQETAKAFVAIVSKIDTPNDAQIKAMESVYSAVCKVLGIDD